MKYTTPLQRSFSIYVYNEKRYVGGLYTSLFCAIIPACSFSPPFRIRVLLSTQTEDLGRPGNKARVQVCRGDVYDMCQGCRKCMRCKMTFRAEISWHQSNFSIHGSTEDSQYFGSSLVPSQGVYTYSQS